MHREGHIGAALAVYAPAALVITAVATVQLAVVGAVAAAALAMVPDYDMQLPLVSHRGITHTVWFAALVGLVGAGSGIALGLEHGPLVAVGLAVMGVWVGAGTVLSHIAADALTPMGVTPYAPYDDQKITYDIANAANPIANKLLLFLGGGLVVGSIAVGHVFT